MLVGQGVAGGQLDIEFQLVLAVAARAWGGGAGRHEHGLALAAGMLSIHLRRVEDGAERLMLSFAQVAGAYGQAVGASAAQGYRRAGVGCC